jgi:hypothetical protein
MADAAVTRLTDFTGWSLFTETTVGLLVVVALGYTSCPTPDPGVTVGWVAIAGLAGTGGGTFLDVSCPPPLGLPVSVVTRGLIGGGADEPSGGSLFDV